MCASWKITSVSIPTTGSGCTGGGNTSPEARFHPGGDLETPEKYLVIQTAFLGDVILTLPLIALLREKRPGAVIDIVVASHAAGVLRGHRDLSEVLVFDKRGADSGVRGLLRISKLIRARRYDCALVPHRSMRSALLAFFGRIPARIGFHTSAGRFLLTSRTRYRPDLHEISRNIELLRGAGVVAPEALRRAERVVVPPPRLYPSETEAGAVDRLLAARVPGQALRGLVCVAPGTAWNTKRWMGERFADLAGRIAGDGYTVVLIGGTADTALCAGITSANPGAGIIDASGRLSVLESAELIGRAELLVCNDSALLHMACAMDTPVVALFGATVPGFGFGPIGPRDTVVETEGLRCRPCSIHGGRTCPIGSFECMERISVERVHAAVSELLSGRPG